ncbi:MAG TPA: hypothetical protein DCQ94_15280 [Nitrospira sp.]|nr:hypothetical protein [Nitrospira sp.]
MKKRSRLSGHSLIEALFASALVVVCALIFAASMPVANTSRAKSDNRNVAVSIAQKQAEAIKAQGYANVTPAQLYTLGLIDSTTPVATDTYSFTNVDTSAFDNPAALLPNGTGRIVVRQAGLDIREILIDVSWNEKGVNRTVRVGTLIANL